MELSLLDGYTPEQIDAYRAAGYWTDDALFDWVERWADEKPHDPFVHDAEVVLTYGELRDRALRVAAALRGLGIRHGDRVAVQLPNWHEFLVVYAAIARVGAVLVPMMTIYRHKEIRHILATTEARAVVVCAAFNRYDHLAAARELIDERPEPPVAIVVRHDGRALRDGEHTLADLERDAPVGIDLGPKPAGDDPHLIGFTSGTESAAKGCLHTWNTYSRTPRLQGRIYEFGPEDCELTPSPITHTSGLAAGLLKPLLAGGRICLQDRWDPAAALVLIGRHGCTQCTGATPFISMMLNAYDPAVHDVSSFRTFVCGGAPVPEAEAERCARILPGVTLLPCFGQTEGLLVTSTVRSDDPHHRITTDGRPIDAVEVRIVDDEGNDLPPGSVGNLLYRSPGCMLGYLGNPEATAKAIRPDKWRDAGDLARVDAQGYLRITGRVKDMIIRGGLNISAREIEEMIVRHERVAQVAIVGLPDPILGERACAFVVPQGDPLTLEELTAYLTETYQLAKVKLPERLEILDALPMTSTGKVQKFVLQSSVA